MLWVSWKDKLKRTETRLGSHGEQEQQHDIIVPTTEIMKLKHLLTLFMSASKPLLFVGSTGTGKTIAISQFLREVQRDKFDALTICFSAKSTAN